MERHNRDHIRTIPVEIPTCRISPLDFLNFAIRHAVSHIMSPRRGMFGWCHSLEKDAEFQIHYHPSKPGSVAEFDGLYGRYGELVHGAPVFENAFSCLISGLIMVFGRYNELVNGGYFMVYKPTNITGGPHPV